MGFWNDNAANSTARFGSDRFEKMLSGELWPGYNYFDFNMRDKVPSLGMLNSLLMGNTSRMAGQAGAGAAGQAMSMGLSNPFAASQRASNNVYQGAAGQFANLPMQQFGMASQASNQDWNRLMQVLMAQMGLLQGQQPTFGEQLGGSAFMGGTDALFKLGVGSLLKPGDNNGFGGGNNQASGGYGIV